MFVRLAPRKLALVTISSLAIILFIVFLTASPGQGRHGRRVPTSADDVISAVKGHVPDDLMSSLKIWASGAARAAPLDPWEAEQRRRKDYINKICYEVREAAEVHYPSPQEMLQYMVLDNVDNVLLCPSLEDARADDWQRVLEEYAERALRLERYARGDEGWEDAHDEHADRMTQMDDSLSEERGKRSTRGDDEDEGRRNKRKKLKEVIEAKSVQEVLGSYYIKANTKVLLVEHPFERLLSFYLETIRDRVGKTGELLSKKILNLHYKSASQKEKRAKQVSFSQFMDYLLFRVSYDPHLKALYYVCHPCDIQYDYIIKMETFHEDVQNINKRIGSEAAEDASRNPEVDPLPARREFSKFNLTDEQWLQGILYDKYSKIHSDKLLKAFDLFSIDIFLFNYSWPFERLSLTKHHNNEAR